MRVRPRCACPPSASAWCGGPRGAAARPEAQTRWEVLDALTLLVPEHAKECGAAYEGAEAALFDEISAPLRLSAYRFLVVWGATERRRSEKVWPIIDEAIQCYHGDLEYRDMLHGAPPLREGVAHHRRGHPVLSRRS